MSIKKWLCESFDEEHKGYVEIGDIAPIILVALFAIGIICAYLFGLYDYLYNGFNFYGPSIPYYLLHFVTHIILIFGSAILLFIMVSLLAKLVYIILKAVFEIKIVECKRDIEDEGDDCFLERVDEARRKSGFENGD